MKMKYKIMISSLCIIIAGIVFFWWINLFNLGKKSAESLIKIDTVYKIIRQEPILVEKMSAKVKYIHDTIYKSREFIASADTIIRYDTVKLSYFFPQNQFSFKYMPKADSIAIEQKNFVKVIEKKRNWWEVPIYILLGGVGFYIISK